MRISIRIDSKAAQAQLRRWGGEFRDKVKKAVARGIASEATELKEDVRTHVAGQMAVVKKSFVKGFTAKVLDKDKNLLTVAITQEHNEARLAGTLSFLNAGSNPARLRIYGGTRPPNPAATPTSAMLVEIALTKPAGTIAGGLLTLTQQEDGLIAATGIATWARLVNGSEVTALDLDCSGTDGAGDVKLASTNLYLGGDARMVSAILG